MKAAPGAQPWRQIASVLLPAFVLAALALYFAVAYVGATRLVTTASVIREPERYPVSVALGREPQATFLDRHLIEMPAIASMQAKAAVGNVLSLGMPHGVYYEGTLTEVLDFSPRFRYLLEIDDPEMLLTELHPRGDEYLLIQWSSASGFLSNPGAPSVSHGSGGRDPSAVPLILGHSRFLEPYLHEIFVGNGISVFAIPAASSGDAPRSMEAAPVSGPQRCRAEAQREQGAASGTPAGCLTVNPDPMLAGFDRGAANVTWSTGSGQPGTLTLSVDDGLESMLDEGRNGRYTLRRLEPGFNYTVRVYVGADEDQTLVAERPIVVWSD